MYTGLLLVISGLEYLFTQFGVLLFLRSERQLILRAVQFLFSSLQNLLQPPPHVRCQNLVKKQTTELWQQTGGGGNH